MQNPFSKRPFFNPMLVIRILPSPKAFLVSKDTKNLESDILFVIIDTKPGIDTSGDQKQSFSTFTQDSLRSRAAPALNVSVYPLKTKRKNKTKI